jgi:hypothetical protein
MRGFSSLFSSDLEFDFPSNEIEQTATDGGNMQCDSSPFIDVQDTAAIMHPAINIAMKSDQFTIDLGFSGDDHTTFTNYPFGRIGPDIGDNDTDFLTGFFGSFVFAVGDFDKGCDFDSGCGSIFDSGSNSGFGSDF